MAFPLCASTLAGIGWPGFSYRRALCTALPPIPAPKRSPARCCRFPLMAPEWLASDLHTRTFYRRTVVGLVGVLAPQQTGSSAGLGGFQHPQAPALLASATSPSASAPPPEVRPTRSRFLFGGGV